jgi:hypothetical protein
MAETLRGFLDLGSFDKTVVKNALITITNLAPQFPLDPVAYWALHGGMKIVHDQCNDIVITEEPDEDDPKTTREVHHATAKPELEDIATQQAISLHNLEMHWRAHMARQGGDGAGAMEEGEVGEDRGREEVGVRRRRDAGDVGDQRPAVRPRSGAGEYGGGAVNGQRSAPRFAPHGRGR